MLLSSMGILAGVYLGKQIIEALQTRRTPKNQEVTPADDEPKRHEHLHHAKISGASAAMVSVGYFIYPPLTLLSIGIISYNTAPIIERAIQTLRTDKKITNDSYSAFVTVLLIGINNNFAAAMHNVVYHVSSYLVAQSREDSARLAAMTYHQAPETVWVISGAIEKQIPLTQIQAGDAVIVTTGEAIPVDGVISMGSALIDQQALTGEANPLEKTVNDFVMAATIVLSGRIVIKAQHSGEQTRIDKLNTLLLQTRDYKTQLQLKGEAWADQVALPLMIGSAALAPVISVSSALALLFSAPLNTVRSMLSVQTAAHMRWITQQGVFIKDGRVLEELPNIDIILFDKTGTLTQSHQEVANVITCAEYDADTLLSLAAAAEQRQEHPVAKAIVDKAVEQTLPLPEVSNSSYDLGMGVTVTIEGQEIRVGSQRFIQQSSGNETLPEEIESAMHHAAGHTFILVSVNGNIAGALELHPRLRPEVPQLISSLRKRGFEQLAIVSGDQQAPTERLAMQLKLDAAYSEVLPEDKAALIKQLQDQGHRVCFVGDGLNDAIAMKQANVSICLSSASALTSEVAQIIMLEDSLAPFDNLFDMAIHLHKGLGKSMSLWIGFGATNALAVPLLGFGPVQSSLLYSLAFITGLQLSKSTPKKPIQRTQENDPIQSFQPKPST